MSRIAEPQIVCPNCGRLSPMGTKKCECGYILKRSSSLKIAVLAVLIAIMIFSIGLIVYYVGQGDLLPEPSPATESPIPSADLEPPQETPSPAPSPSFKPTRSDYLETIYYNPDSAVFHSSQNCPELSGTKLSNYFLPERVSQNFWPCSTCITLKKEYPHTGYIPYSPITLKISDEHAPLSITAPNNQSLYVILYNENPLLHSTIFVNAGETADVEVCLGVYEIYYAGGEHWYGETFLFGAETSFYKCDGTFDFYYDGSYFQGWTIELYEQEDGNMETDKISAEEFMNKLS